MMAPLASIRIRLVGSKHGGTHPVSFTCCEFSHIWRRFCDLPHSRKRFTAAILTLGGSFSRWRKQRREAIMRPLVRKYVAAYWLQAFIGVLAAALLMALGVRQTAPLTSFATHAAARGGPAGMDVMGRGGQFERPPVW
jgi:hypothetical protein